MSLPSRWRASGTLLAIALLLLPGILVAQDGAPAEPDRRAQADHLHALAMTAARFVEHQEDRVLIVRMHAEAAHLRDADDPRAYECLRFQGSLLHGIGELNEAAGFFENAADIALRNGDSFGAAHALLDAAGVRLEQGRITQARSLSREADRLSRERGVTWEERQQLQRRIGVR